MIWQIVLYYVLIAVVLLLRGRPRLRLVFACGAAVWLLGLCLAPGWQPCTAVLYGGDSEIPVVVIERDRGLAPIVINSGSTKCHRDLAAWLQHRGHREIDVLIIPWGVSRGGRAAPLSVQLLGVNSLIVPRAALRRGPGAAAAAFLFERGGRIRALTSLGDGLPLSASTGETLVHVQAGAGGQELSLASLTPECPVQLRVSAATGGRWGLTVQRHGGPPTTITLIPSMRRRLQILSDRHDWPG